MEFKHLNLDEILKAHSNEVLTPKTIEKIEGEWKDKESEWMHEERF